MVDVEGGLHRAASEHGRGDGEAVVVDGPGAHGLDGQVRRAGAAVEKGSAGRLRPGREVQRLGVLQAVVEPVAQHHRRAEVGHDLAHRRGHCTHARGRCIDGRCQASRQRFQAAACGEEAVGRADAAAHHGQGPALACGHLPAQADHQGAAARLGHRIAALRRRAAVERLGHRDRGRLQRGAARGHGQRQRGAIALGADIGAVADHRPVGGFGHVGGAIGLGDDDVERLVVGDRHIDRAQGRGLGIGAGNQAVGLAVQADCRAGAQHHRIARVAAQAEGGAGKVGQRRTTGARGVDRRGRP